MEKLEKLIDSYFWEISDSNWQDPNFFFDNVCK